MMRVVGRAKGSVLYWLLKVAVPQMRGGRVVERGWVGGILEVEDSCSFEEVVSWSLGELYLEVA